MPSPLAKVFDIRKEDIPIAVMMFLYFFLVITTFWILKPIKKSTFITYYDETGYLLPFTGSEYSQSEFLLIDGINSNETLSAYAGTGEINLKINIDKNSGHEDQFEIICSSDSLSLNDLASTINSKTDKISFRIKEGKIFLKRNITGSGNSYNVTVIDVNNSIFNKLLKDKSNNILEANNGDGTRLKASQAELLAKVLNMLVAFIAVIVFTVLSRKYRRQQLTTIFSAFFIGCYVIYSFLLNNPNGPVVWTFYLFGDLFSTIMVATFFSFLNDSVSPDDAKRLYGVIGLGGVAGGVFGTNFLRIWIDVISISGWMWVCLIIGLAIIFIALYAGKKIRLPEIEATPPPVDKKEEKKVNEKNPAVEGAALVFNSSYLLSIVAIVGLYEIVSTIMDFQFTETISHFLSGEDIGRQFATVFAITNIVSMIVQLFLTSFVMTRFGLTIALSILPLSVMLGSTAFAILPALWVGSMLNTADNAFSYSINQSAKESLYVPTTKDEKYKAKAFIDMFVQRFAKALAVGVSLLITTWFTDFSSLRYLSIFTIVIVVLWLIAVRHAGKTFKEMTEN